MSDHSTFDSYLKPKAYEFVFSPRALIFLLSGLAILAVLIFAGGISVGTRLVPVAQSADLSPEVDREPPPPSELGVIIVEPLSEVIAETDDSHELLALEDVEPPAVGVDYEELVVESASSQPELPVRTIFELQLGLYYRRIQADLALEDYQVRGYQPYVVEVLSSTGVSRYTLRLGPFGSMGEALEAQATFVGHEGEAATIRFRDVPE